MKQEFNIGDKVYFLLEHTYGLVGGYGMGRRFTVKEGFIVYIWKRVFIYKDRISSEQQENLHQIDYEINYDLDSYSYKNPPRIMVTQEDLYRMKEDIIK